MTYYGGVVMFVKINNMIGKLGVPTRILLLVLAMVYVIGVFILGIYTDFFVGHVLLHIMMSVIIGGVFCGLFMGFLIVSLFFK